MLSYQEFSNNFINKRHYKFDNEKNIYLSGLSSVYENLLYADYGFPKFLKSLNNEFNFNFIISDMVSKYAPQSMDIHRRLSKRYSSYTFHSLTKDDMDIITFEAYNIYCKIQNFLNNLSETQKKYIEILNKHYDHQIKLYVENNKYISSIDTLTNSVNEYIQTYNTNTPKFDFEVLIR